MKCSYGCSQEGKFQLQNRKWCCVEKWRQCPAQLEKNKIIGSGKENPMFGKPSWNKGLNINDPLVKKYSKSMKETKKVLSEQGKITAWNKNLTKETDSRVEKYSITMKVAKKGKPNYKLRKPISDLSGSYGILIQRLKGRLYISWKFPILKRDNFRCTVCGRKESLEVHHLLKSFREIYSDCIEKLKLDISKWKSWSKEEIENLENEVLECHTLEVGKTFCKKHHGEIDPHRKRLLRKEEKC